MTTITPPILVTEVDAMEAREDSGKLTAGEEMLVVRQKCCVNSRAVGWGVGLSFVTSVILILCDSGLSHKL